jgi:hypothetical protein
MKILSGILISMIILILISNCDNSKTITVHPREIGDPLTNPYSGWGIWLGPRFMDGKSISNEYNTTGFEDDAPLFKWALVDLMWADLEPEEGKFYWEKFDSILIYWKARNKQFLIRITVSDDPGWDGAPGNTACPDWIWNLGVKYHEYKGEGNSQKREPDYVDPSYEKVYIPHLRNFLTAFAKHYQKPANNIMMFQVMGYGQWGEWHTLWSKYPWPDKDVKHKVLTNIIQQYKDIFDSTKLSISYCWDNDNPQVTSMEDFTYRQATDLAIANDFCLTRHAFIDGFGKWDTKVMENHWKHCPLLAEANWTYLEIKNQSTHGTFDQNLNIMLEWHSIYAHFYTNAEGYKRSMKEDKATIERGLKAGGLGYRYVLTSASWDKELNAGRMLILKQSWINRNVGWCPKQFPLKIYFTDKEGNEKYSAVDKAFDISKLYKGEIYCKSTMVSLSKGTGEAFFDTNIKKLDAGEYDLRIALVDETFNPALKLGIEGIDKQGRYKLGTIRILPAN